MEISRRKLVKKVCPSTEDLSVIVNDYQCGECNLHFKNASRYRMHSLKVHQRKELVKTGINNDDEDIQYHCPVKNCPYALNCERFFKKKKYLKQHFLKIHAEKKYVCTQCDKSFSTESAKEAHVRVCGINFDCIICSKTYSTYEALLTHAKRNLHEIDEKYKRDLRQLKLKKRTRIKSINVPELRKLTSILPKTSNPEKNKIQINKKKGILITFFIPAKSTRSIGVQTQKHNEPYEAENVLLDTKIKNEVTQESPINQIKSETILQTSKETQTTNHIQLKVNITHKLQKDRLVGNLSNSFSSENLFPNSPLDFHHDVELSDLWVDKNNSGTQTGSEKDIFEPFCEEDTTNMNDYKITRADPLLNEEEFTDRFSSIETQTERIICQSLFDSDSLSRSLTLNSNNETQTTESFISIEPLQVYNHSFTQTCEILSPDLELSNIQTQTAWSHFEDTTVSTETQTRDFPCESGCEDSNHDCRSWLSIQTNHMETQTDLFSLLENLN